jgi:hypothetical protein
MLSLQQKTGAGWFAMPQSALAFSSASLLWCVVARYLSSASIFTSLDVAPGQISVKLMIGFVVYITLLQVTSLIADDYDTSATCLQQSAVQPLDRSIEALLAGFTKWDAVYFLRISEVCAGL